MTSADDEKLNNALQQIEELQKELSDSKVTSAEKVELILLTFISLFINAVD